MWVVIEFCHFSLQKFQSRICRLRQLFLFPSLAKWENILLPTIIIIIIFESREKSFSRCFLLYRFFISRVERSSNKLWIIKIKQKEKARKVFGMIEPNTPYVKDGDCSISFLLLFCFDYSPTEETKYDTDDDEHNCHTDQNSNHRWIDISFWFTWSLCDCINRTTEVRIDRS